MKRWLKWLKPAAKIGLAAAPDLLSAVFPGVGVVTDAIIPLVLQAEAEIGPGRGADKKAWVIDQLPLALKLVIPMMEKMTGRQIDDDAFVSGLSKIIDGVVEMLNSMGVLPKKAA